MAHRRRRRLPINLIINVRSDRRSAMHFIKSAVRPITEGEHTIEIVPGTFTERHNPAKGSTSFTIDLKVGDFGVRTFRFFTHAPNWRVRVDRDLDALGSWAAALGVEPVDTALDAVKALHKAGKGKRVLGTFRMFDDRDGKVPALVSVRVDRSPTTGGDDEPIV
jgi:hypothetical protein